jgi:DHA1 family bicyclomycin/chloramphenicol resistance-like MFS transporter
MMGVSLVNVALAAWLPSRTRPGPCCRWRCTPSGWSMMVPAVTLLVLDLVPDRRGMASSVQSSLGSAVNARWRACWCRW